MGGPGGGGKRSLTLPWLQGQHELFAACSVCPSVIQGRNGLKVVRGGPQRQLKNNSSWEVGAERSQGGTGGWERWALRPQHVCPGTGSISEAAPLCPQDRQSHHQTPESLSPRQGPCFSLNPIPSPLNPCNHLPSSIPHHSPPWLLWVVAGKSGGGGGWKRGCYVPSFISSFCLCLEDLHSFFKN